MGQLLGTCRPPTFWRTDTGRCRARRPISLCRQLGAETEDHARERIGPQLFLHQRSPSIPLRKSTGFVAINNFSFNYLPLGEDRSVTRFGPSALAIRASNDAGLLGRTREPGSAPLLGHGLVVPAAKWVKGRERIAAAAS